MIKKTMIALAVWVIPSLCLAETPLIESHSKTIDLARAQKIGVLAEDNSAGGIKTPPAGGSGKEAYDCTVNQDCSVSEKCVGNTCVSSCTNSNCSGTTPECINLTSPPHTFSCVCTANSCPSGKKCSGSVCTNCPAGSTDCNCPIGQTADGSGDCRACTALSCSAGNYYDTTTCACRSCPSREKCSCPGVGFSDGRGSCTSDPYTCAPGKVQNLSTFGCDNCTAGQKCGCPDGQLADGKGSCSAVACSTLADCPEGSACLNGGTLKASCSLCTAGADSTSCNCPSGKYANGSGACVDCTQDSQCGTGKKCTDGICVSAGKSCKTQTNCSIGEECVGGYCKTCGQGSQTKPFCNQGSNSGGSGSGTTNPYCTNCWTSSSAPRGYTCDCTSNASYWKICSSGSNQVKGYCNCPSGTFSDGRGGCSSCSSSTPGCTK